MNYYTAKYKKEVYTKTLTQWVEFLSDKPVEHITQSSMRGRIKRGKTRIEVCLGIDDIGFNTRKYGQKKTSNPMVAKNDLDQYNTVNLWLRRKLA